MDILQVVVTEVQLFDAHSRLEHGYPRIRNGFPRIRSAGGRRDTPTVIIVMIQNLIKSAVSLSDTVI